MFIAAFLLGAVTAFVAIRGFDVRAEISERSGPEPALASSRSDVNVIPLLQKSDEEITVQTGYAAPRPS
jgi:hypothetical protein